MPPAARRPGRFRRLIAAAMLMAWCSGCGPFPVIDRLWPDAYWRHDGYVLLALDTQAQMELSYDSKRNGVRSIVGPTVFSVGANDQFVVAQQHPSGDGIHFDRSVTNYFIVNRATEPGMGVYPRLRVIGPLTKAQFTRLSGTLRLPPFSKTFHSLEWHSTHQ